MKVYLVGGAVRDERLGIPVSERDWCVVGATPEQMQAQGFRRVGRDFPVFLHPDTGEEYALARTERKTGSGYHGFEFATDPTVTIEQDLGRRDLTINAMAIDDSGELIDPYGGLRDLEQRKLRHVSGAFTEDPVRVLRVAKFAARFADLDFTIAAETRDLMTAIVDSGEADALVPDRVWKETEAALRGPSPQVYFQVLRDCGALALLIPEVDALFGIPQPERWHPEIDCGLHCLMVVEQAAQLSDAGEVRFAGLVHDLGKATTRRQDLPQHPGHERRSVKLIGKLARRLPVPAAWRDLAVLVAEFHTHCHRAFELRGSTVLKVLERTDAFRRPERFEKFLTACEADARGRSGLENRPYPQADYFRGAAQAAAEVNAKEIAAGLSDGGEIGTRIRLARLRVLEAYKRRSAHDPNV
ncbi:MAG: multifunctional CCA addition/repair protein [Gammaproteobacteria bacterium]|nr:multifunctional CCA addition/repair protein [Gammaproteobacteria bacterium]